MVTTRSNNTYDLDSESYEKINTSTSFGSSKENKEKKNALNFKISHLLKLNNQDNNNENSNDNESINSLDTDDESFSIPKSIKRSKTLKKQFNKIKKKIQKKTPKLEKLLTLKIRQIRKIELIELFYIFKYNTYPYTEERLHLKEVIIKKIKKYIQEYKEFKKNKNDFLLMERNQKSNNDLFVIKQKILSLKTTDLNRDILLSKYNSIEANLNRDEEYFKILQYLQYTIKLPFQQEKIPFIIKNNTNQFLLNLRKKLDDKLYGMTDVKEQIMLFIHNRILNNNNNMKPTLCLLGPSGIGKTSIAKALSEVLDIPFAQINMGGCTNAETLLGHSFTYVSSRPGKIAQALINMKYSNGIIFFDEMEKANNDDVVNTLLHITDYTSNSNFKDNYFGEISIDLSKIFFICSMNEKPMDKALSDRLFYIKMNDYSIDEKLKILRDYLFPNSLLSLNLKKNDIIFPDKEMKIFIQQVSDGNSGVRRIKQYLNEMISKISFIINNPNVKTSFSLDEKEYNFPINYPFTITKYVINKLAKNYETKNINPSIMHLYI